MTPMCKAVSHFASSFRWLAIVICLFLAQTAFGQTEADQTRQTEVYKTVGDVELALQIFVPEGHMPTDRRPAAVFFFGGGWKGGTTEQFVPHCEYLASRGMIGIVADYRVESRHGTTPFDCVADAKSAIRWVRRNSEKIGIDPTKIAAGGGSAGGHLAAATATVEGLNSDGDPLDVSAIPNALLLFNPVYDNGPDGYGHNRVGDRYTEISPMHNIREGMPPAIVFLGTNDSLIPVETAEQFQREMQRVGSRSELFLYEDQPHGFFNKRATNRFGQRDYYYETVLETDRFLTSLGFLSGEPTLSAPQFAFSLVEDEYLELAYQGRPVARYMIAFDRSTSEREHDTYKPFLHVFDRDGTRTITKGPGGQFTHHRGIFVGFNKTQFNEQSYDLWHMRTTSQVHHEFLEQSTSENQASFVSEVHWQDHDENQILAERRTLRFRNAPRGGFLLVELDTELIAAHGDVRLDGDPEHAGAQFRPADDVVRSETRYHFHESDIDPTVDRDMPWVAETFHLGDDQFTIVMLNHSSNPQETIFSAYRDYGRFGAFPTIELAQGESQRLRYQWIICDGELPEREIIDAAIERFESQ